MREIQVPVIIDVTADNAEQAARIAVGTLAAAGIVGKGVSIDPDEQVTQTHRVESWWTVEQCAKEADGNDNEHGVIVFENDLDYLYIVLRRAGVVPPGQRARHDRLVRYFAKSGRCGSADDRDTTDDE